ILSLATIAALGERHIDPTSANCQRTFIKKYKVSFHRQNQATLPNIKQQDGLIPAGRNESASI
ncbi:hypothetical protein, partial [Brucella sp.]|uniref:hypothetical protein n=1 Tax=Brucella sp. TaxID=52132 RepID=UPI0028A5A3DE